MMEQATATYRSKHWGSQRNEPAPDAAVGGKHEWVPRPELDAKLGAIEVKVDSKLARFVGQMTDLNEHVKNQNDQVKKQKASIWGAAVTTWGIFIAVLALAFAAFDSGRETEKLISETRRSIELTLKDTEKKQASIQATLDQNAQQGRIIHDATQSLIKALEASQKNPSLQPAPGSLPEGPRLLPSPRPAPELYGPPWPRQQ